MSVIEIVQNRKHKISDKEITKNYKEPMTKENRATLLKMLYNYDSEEKANTESDEK